MEVLGNAFLLRPMVTSLHRTQEMRSRRPFQAGTGGGRTNRLQSLCIWFNGSH